MKRLNNAECFKDLAVLRASKTFQSKYFKTKNNMKKDDWDIHIYKLQSKTIITVECPVKCQLDELNNCCAIIDMGEHKVSQNSTTSILIIFGARFFAKIYLDIFLNILFSH